MPASLGLPPSTPRSKMPSISWGIGIIRRPNPRRVVVPSRQRGKWQKRC
jgi:hypothetical protein